MRVRRPTRVTGQRLLALSLALGVLLGLGSARAATPGSSESSFFRLSRIEAVSVPGQSATRYSVTVSNAPPGHANAPSSRWYLNLKTVGREAAPELAGSAPAVGCDNSLLPGEQRLSEGRYVWNNQGPTFVWYHGERGSYAADRSYGCDQTKIGQGGYPGTVTVIFENDYEHCTATFKGTPTGARPAYGPPATCALGGYIATLPVPSGLLHAYATLDSRLTALIRQAQQGAPLGKKSALGASLGSIRRAQANAFRLFPPIWGCRFDSLFDRVVLAKGAFAAQLAGLATGRHLPSSSFRADTAYVTSLANGLRACAPSASRPLGTPRSVVAAVDALAAETNALSGQSASLEARLRALDGTLDSIIRMSFPAAFGMSYIDLVNRVLAESSAADDAQRAASAGNSSEAISALEQVAAPVHRIRHELQKAAKRSTTAEKSA